MKNRLLYFSIGYLPTMVFLGLIISRDLNWWIFQLTSYIIILLAIVLYYRIKWLNKENKIDKTKVMKDWSELTNDEH